MADGRAGLELVPAGAGDHDLFVFWVNAGFHWNLLVALAAESTRLKLAASPRHGTLYFRLDRKNQCQNRGRE